MFTMRELWQLDDLLTTAVNADPEDHLIALLAKVRKIISSFEEEEPTYTDD